MSKKQFTKSFTNTAGIKNESNKLAKMKENVKITRSKSHERNERNICVITKIMKENVKITPLKSHERNERNNA